MSLAHQGAARALAAWGCVHSPVQRSVSRSKRKLLRCKAAEALEKSVKSQHQQADGLPVDSEQIGLAPVQQQSSASEYASVTLETLRPIEDEPTTKPLFELGKEQSFWLLNIVAFLCGTNTTGVKAVLEESGLVPSLVSALRFDVAALCLVPLLFRPNIKAVNWSLSWELGLWLALGYCLQAQELLTSSASEGSILLAVYLTLVPLIELFHGRSLTFRKVAALAVAVGGIALLAAGGRDDGPEIAVEAAKTIMGLPEGQFYGLLGSIAFGLHLVRSEVRQHEAADVGQLAASQMVTCAAFCTAWAAADVVANPAVAAQMSPAHVVEVMPWAAFLATSILCTAGCQTGELIAVGKIPASTASLTLSMLVVWGLFAGAIINHDQLTPLSWAGASLIVGAGIVPKALDVLAERQKGTDEPAGGSPQPAPGQKLQMDGPPVEFTPEELVRTTVAASMLFESGVLVSESFALSSMAIEASATAASAAGSASTAAMSGATAVASGASAAASGTAAAVSSTAAAASSTIAAASGTATAMGGATAAGSGAAATAATAATTAATSGAATGAAAAASTVAASAASSAVTGAAAAPAAVSSVAASTASVASTAAAAANVSAGASVAASSALSSTAANAAGAVVGSGAAIAAADVAASAAGAAAAAAPEVAAGVAVETVAAVGATLSEAATSAAPLIESAGTVIADTAAKLGPAASSLLP